MKSSLRFIDFLSHNMKDRIIDELSYSIKRQGYEPNEHIFKSGDRCDSICIIQYGEVDVILIKEYKETYLETLTQGSNFGTYTALLRDP